MSILNILNVISLTVGVCTPPDPVITVEPAPEFAVFSPMTQEPVEDKIP